MEGAAAAGDDGGGSAGRVTFSGPGALTPEAVSVQFLSKLASPRESGMASPCEFATVSGSSSSAHRSRLILSGFFSCAFAAQACLLR